ncbi:MAG: sulfatase [Planctomycetota bacterium]
MFFRIAFPLAAFLVAALSAASAERTNFLFVIADDCTFRDIGCYGGQAHTPNIDRLATQGMKMSHCFQCAPMCSPTRHNIYTGQYPVKTGAYPNHTATYRDVTNITHLLKPLGYRVALSGKTHIGPRDVFPFEYSGKKNPDMQAVDQLFGECVETETPFCLFACSNEPHSPWDKGDASRYPPSEVKLPPYLADTPEVRDAFSRYLAEITYYDSQVGELLTMLEKHDLTDDTVVMVVSEQGNSFPFAKWTCYDNGLQSAMIVRWPGKVEAGSTTDAMVEYVDVTPTFLDIAGGQPEESMDGKSFLKVLTGEATEHKQHVFGEMTTRGIINGNDCYPIRSVRSRTRKLIVNFQHDQKFTNACTQSKEFRSIRAAADAGDAAALRVVQRYQHRPEIEFYDVEKDPLEMTNLADDASYAEEITRLRGVLDRWMRSQGDKGVETEMVANHHKKNNKKRKQKSR